MRLLVATRNQKKKKELKALLKGLDIKVITLEDVKTVPLIRENGRTFEENAVKKAVKTAKYTGCLTIADDSGLEVKALNGAPGVFSARFAGRAKSDLRNNEKLLRLLKDMPKSERKARFVCVIAVADESGLLKVIKGTAGGYIADDKHGNCGFGYDPVFIPGGFDKTFAQLGPKVKNKISHRAKALGRARMFLKKLSEKSSQGF